MGLSVWYMLNAIQGQVVSVEPHTPHDQSTIDLELLVLLIAIANVRKVFSEAEIVE
jgi:hypothetical protein